jgi:hypothetical protein
MLSKRIGIHPMAKHETSKKLEAELLQENAVKHELGSYGSSGSLGVI